MGRRRQAVLEMMKGLGFFFTILSFVIVFAVIMVLCVPVGLVWLVSPTLGDWLIWRITYPLMYLLDYGSRMDTWI